MSETKNLNLTKKEISKKISLRTGLPMSYTNKITDDLINILKDMIREKVTNIKNFATFKTINKSERIGRNPKNKKNYKIKARKSLSITVSKYLNDKIKKI